MSTNTLTSMTEYTRTNIPTDQQTGEATDEKMFAPMNSERGEFRHGQDEKEDRIMSAVLEASGHPDCIADLTEGQVKKTYLVMSKWGASQSDLAVTLGTSQETIEKWYQRGVIDIAEGSNETLPAAFVRAHQMGLDKFNSDVAEASLLKKIQGYEAPEVKDEETLVSAKELKKRGLVVNTEDVDDNGYVSVTKRTTTYRHVSPDTKAITFFLKNRDGSRWADEQNVNVNDQSSISNKKKNKSDEQKGKEAVADLSDEELEILERAYSKVRGDKEVDPDQVKEYDSNGQSTQNSE